MSPPPKPRISCIIPAYNEAARIGAVLQAVSDHPDLLEVLVIDDASRDGTADLAEKVPGISVIRQPRNGGKTRALAAGFRAMRGSHVLMLDADLVGLGPADVSALIAPIARGEAEMSISLRGNAPWPWRAIGLDYISGERVMHRDLLPAPDALANLPNFGFEVFLNERLIAAAGRLAVVPWPHVRSPAKEIKHGFRAGLKADIAMMRDIFRTIPPHRLVRQIIAMRRLRTR